VKALSDFRNIWQKCYLGSKQSKDMLYFSISPN